MSFFFSPTFKPIDSFEDQSLSEYTDASGRYTVPTADASFARHGDYYVDFVGSQGSGAGLVSTSGLPNYPAPGDTFKAYSQFVYAADFGGIQFACQTESSTFPDGYRCQIDGGQDRIEIIVQTGGGGTFNTIGTAPLTLSNFLNEWLEHDVTWATNGDITYTVSDATGTQQASVTANDTTYTAQAGFGWASETNSSLDAEQHVYHDMAHILA